jgi:uncharacterized protein (TIGR02996 family)
MNVETTLLQAIQADPRDEMAWLAWADCLEEQGQADRANLLRLHRSLRTDLPADVRQEREEQVRQLLEEGIIRPCVPLLTNSIGMQLALIPPGSFFMGSLPQEGNRYADEQPRHPVEITRPFYLGVYQVTQEEYERVTGENPAWFSSTGGWQASALLDTSRFPVESVSWEFADRFCALLSELPRERRAGRVYRLPTEAEWEYACRGGAASAVPFHFGWTLSSYQANFDGNYPFDSFQGPYLEHPTPVGSYRPNAFGLYDMHGNVWEWCQDWFGPTWYANSPVRDPQGPPEGTARVHRGGSWYSYGWACRAGQRSRGVSGEGNYRTGLRVVMETRS